MSKRAHASIRLTVDLVILTVRQGRLKVLLIERDNDPFQGCAALPGGFLRADEDIHDAAVRELREETQLDASRLHLEQLPVFGAPDRDPRGRIVTVPFLAIAPDLPVPTAGSDARGATWEPTDDILANGAVLAFDHEQILRTGLERARVQLENTTLATAFCPEEFTVGDLREVYEVVWGMALDPRNFNRKVTHTEGFLEPLGTTRSAGTGRPAALYRKGDAVLLNPPMLRTGGTTNA